MRHWRTTGNRNIATQTGSTYISESTTDIITIPTANLSFSTMASSKKMSLGESNNDRQPEMAAKTRNTYISETMTDIIKIPSPNLGFTTIESSNKVSASDCNSDHNRKWLYRSFGHQSCRFGLSVVVAITWQHHYRARHGGKSAICRWNFDAICHSSTDIIISGFVGHFRLSVIIIIGIAWQGHSLHARRGRKPYFSRWNFDDICHILSDI